MKKLLLLITITLISITAVNAQCTPDPLYTSPGVYPDSATGLSDACVGVAYDQVITNVVPADTLVEIIPGVPQTISIDSIRITSFTGLPSTLTYACNSPQNITSPITGCTFEGGTIGCVSITGTPTSADIGTHNLIIDLTIYVGGGGAATAQTQTVDWYSIIVDSVCTSGVIENTLFEITAYPNPVNSILTVSGLNNVDFITITDASGKVMRSNKHISSSTVDMNVENLETGIYFINIIQNNSSRTIRFVKK